MKAGEFPFDAKFAKDWSLAGRRQKRRLRKITPPAGLVFHCEDCMLVVPDDAPRPEGGECASVAKAKLSHFYPEAPLATQWAMAAATWSLIYRGATSGPAPHAESFDYTLKAHSHLTRSSHFGQSAVRKAMTGEQVARESAHPHVGWLYRKVR